MLSTKCSSNSSRRCCSSCSSSNDRSMMVLAVVNTNINDDSHSTCSKCINTIVMVITVKKR